MTYFAATPPLEELKILFSMAMTEGVVYEKGKEKEGMQLEFIDINQIDFPSIKFARDALVSGGIMPAVMNAANEIAVERFINNEIKFDLIFDIIEHVMEKFDLEESIIDPTLDQIINADEKARLTSVKYINSLFTIHNNLGT